MPASPLFAFDSPLNPSQAIRASLDQQAEGRNSFQELLPVTCAHLLAPSRHLQQGPVLPQQVISRMEDFFWVRHQAEDTVRGDTSSHAACLQTMGASFLLPAPSSPQVSLHAQPKLHLSEGQHQLFTHLPPSEVALKP